MPVSTPWLLGLSLALLAKYWLKVGEQDTSAVKGRMLIKPILEWMLLVDVIDC